MALRDFYTKRTLNPASRENHECIAGLRRKIPSVSMEKVIRIIDEVIEETVQGKLGKLVYTRTGFLLGDSSAMPHADHSYLWRVIPGKLIGKTTDQLWDPLESKLVLRTIGTLVMWRIALRGEDWLVSFLDSGRMDLVTGKEIKIAQYWVGGI